MLTITSSTDHAKELEFLVCLSLPSLTEPRLARAKELSNSSLDWTYLLSAAAFHGVVPAFSKHVREHFESDVPSDVGKQLNIRIKHIMTQNLALVGTFLRFYADLQKQDIKSAVFKGPALALLAYKDLFLREFSDVDLLVGQQDVRSTQQLLLALGYEPLPKRDPPLSLSFIQSQRFLVVATEHSFARQNPSGLIDLHWEVQPSHLLPLTAGEVLANTIELSMEGAAVRTIEPNLLFVVLSAHASKHAWDRLIWICDTAQLLLHCPELDWQKIYEISDRLRVSDMVTFALLLAHRFFDSDLPASAVSRKTEMLESLVEDVVLNLPVLHTEGTGYLLRRCRFSTTLTSGLRGKMRFLIREFFQPTVPDLLRLRLPDSLFFVYFVLHPLWLLYDAAGRRFQQLRELRQPNSAE